MSNKICLLLFWAGLSLLLNSCGGTDAGNPRNPAFGLQTIQDNPNFNYFLRSASISLESIDFVGFQLCGTSENLVTASLQGPFVIDLVNETITPALDANAIPEGRFCEIRLNIKPNSELNNKSVLATGELRDDATPIEVKVTNEDQIALANLSEGILLSDGLLVFLTFNLDQWFRNIRLTQLDRTLDTIEISDDTNANAQTQFIENLKSSAALFRDENQNSRLDESEAEESKELAEPRVTED